MSGLLTTDSERRITSFNPEAERISGTSAAEALGCDVEEVLPGIAELVFSGADQRIGSRSRARMASRDRRGREMHLGVAAYVLVEGDAESGGYVVIFQDVTEVVAMETELRRSERLAAVGELSASIAHEIRNPLAAISGAIQILRGQLGAEQGESGRLMEIALRETDRLDHLITDFLHYARPSAPRPERVAVAGLVSEVRQMFDASRPDGVEIADLVPSGLAVFADAGQLRQVLWNLVLNAAQAMPGGGTLRISAHIAAQKAPQGAYGAGRMEGVEKRASVEIVVADEGEGIPPDVLERVFDPFFTTKQGGSGLGLATVHRIVQEHGGSIRIESRLGRGSAVKLRLPGEEAA